VVKIISGHSAVTTDENRRIFESRLGASAP